jgi:hypothetical protein
MNLSFGLDSLHLEQSQFIGFVSGTILYYYVTMSLYCLPQLLIYSLGGRTLYTPPFANLDDDYIHLKIRSALYGFVVILLTISGKAGIHLEPHQVG